MLRGCFLRYKESEQTYKKKYEKIPVSSLVVLSLILFILFYFFRKAHARMNES